MTHLSPSTINGTKGLGEVLSYVNIITDTWISKLFLIGIYVIILMGYYKSKEDFRGSMAVAGYGTFVVAFLFWIGGFVSGYAFGVSIAMSILGTLILLLDND